MFKKIISISLTFVLAGQLLAAAPPARFNDDKTKDYPTDVPAALNDNFDRLLDEWYISKGITECDAVKSEPVFGTDSLYMKRLYALPTKMELAYNDIVKRYIEMYIDRRRGQVARMLGLGTLYFPMFEDALDKENLPLELKYLPIIESALNATVRSRAGAAGLWQFMPATGRLYNLEVNSLVDERNDPVKSTQAAARYLKDMYAIYGDWNLVIAAYNCGPGNVNKAIRRSGGKRDYWDIYPYLPKETRGYVPAFIAATYIMSYHNEHKICPSAIEMPAYVDTIGVNKMLHLEQVANVLNIPIEELRLLNPQYRADIIPGEYKQYALTLPIKNLTSFIDNEQDVYAYKATELISHQKIRTAAAISTSSVGRSGKATHRVKRGESIGLIAKKYGVGVSQIRAWNKLKSDRINPGDQLIVSNYVAPSVKSRTTKSIKSSTPVKEIESTKLVVDNGELKKSTKVTKETTEDYLVKKGDTWNAIVRATGASITDIKRWNNIKGNNIIAGQTIKIRRTITEEELTPIAKPEEIVADNSQLKDSFSDYLNALMEDREIIPTNLMNTLDGEDVSVDENQNIVVHDIIVGETLSEIAKKYNVTVEDLILWNNLDSDYNNDGSRTLMIYLPTDSKMNIVDSKSSSIKNATQV